MSAWDTQLLTDEGVNTLPVSEPAVPDEVDVVVPSCLVMRQVLSADQLPAAFDVLTTRIGGSACVAIPKNTKLTQNRIATVLAKRERKTRRELLFRSLLGCAFTEPNEGMFSEKCVSM